MKTLYKCNNCKTLSATKLTPVTVIESASPPYEIGICGICVYGVEQREGLYNDSKKSKGEDGITFNAPAEEPKKELPEGKRVVRTPTSGDRVYLLDEVKKTRQWIATGEVLTALGYDQADVQDETDANLYKYSMGTTIYKVDA